MEVTMVEISALEMRAVVEGMVVLAVAMVATMVTARVLEEPGGPTIMSGTCAKTQMTTMQAATDQKFKAMEESMKKMQASIDALTPQQGNILQL